MTTHALSEEQKAFERAREAVRFFRAQPLDSDQDAAAVAADACEEAGLAVDAHWYRYAAGLSDDHPGLPLGTVFWARSPDQLDTASLPIGDAEGLKR